MSKADVESQVYTEFCMEQSVAEQGEKNRYPLLL